MKQNKAKKRNFLLSPIYYLQEITIYVFIQLLLKGNNTSTNYISIMSLNIIAKRKLINLILKYCSPDDKNRAPRKTGQKKTPTRTRPN